VPDNVFAACSLRGNTLLKASAAVWAYSSVPRNLHTAFVTLFRVFCTFSDCFLPSGLCWVSAPEIHTFGMFLRLFPRLFLALSLPPLFFGRYCTP
jgi:hypothetical protein